MKLAFEGWWRKRCCFRRDLSIRLDFEGKRGLIWGLANLQLKTSTEGSELSISFRISLDLLNGKLFPGVFSSGKSQLKLHRRLRVFKQRGLSIVDRDLV